MILFCVGFMLKGINNIYFNLLFREKLILITCFLIIKIIVIKGRN